MVGNEELEKALTINDEAVTVNDEELPVNDEDTEDDGENMSGEEELPKGGGGGEKGRNSGVQLRSINIFEGESFSNSVRVEPTLKKRKRANPTSALTPTATVLWVYNIH